MDPTVLVENPCSLEKIADIFWPIINDAVAVYQAVFGASIQSIRLMGSVARGQANPHSDIDFIALLRTRPTQEQMRRIDELEKRMRHNHAFVSKVDLEAVWADSVAEFRRFVLTTDSVTLFGSDHYVAKQEIWDRRQLADMVTPDLAGLVISYRSALEKAGDENGEILSFYSRLIGKDILKCFRRVALLRGCPYQRNIGRIHEQLLQFAPELKEVVEELHDLYVHPSDDKQRLLTTLRRVETSSSLLSLT
jgi:predicted nucleotidyltransferase